MRVNVLRNRNCPTFAPSVVDISIDQSSVSRVIYDANATDPDAAVSQVAIKIMKNGIDTIFQNERKKLKSCYFASLQNTPFSTVRYSLIGDENSQVLFRVDDQTGQVFTNEPSLFSDQGTIYQVRKSWLL